MLPAPALQVIEPAHAAATMPVLSTGQQSILHVSLAPPAAVQFAVAMVMTAALDAVVVIVLLLVVKEVAPAEAGWRLPPAMTALCAIAPVAEVLVAAPAAALLQAEEEAVIVIPLALCQDILIMVTIIATRCLLTAVHARIVLITVVSPAVLWELLQIRATMTLLHQAGTAIIQHHAAKLPVNMAVSEDTVVIHQPVTVK